MENIVKRSFSTAPLVLLGVLSLVLLSQSDVSANSPSWMSGDLSGVQRDDLSTNPDDYGMYGKCINETVQLAGAWSTSEACMFQAKSFRYSVISGRLYIRTGSDPKLYPINNVGFISNTHVTPSPNTDDFVFGSVVVKDLPSKITFNSQNAGSYDPDESFSYALSLDEQNNDYTISSRSVSRNGEWEVINVQNIGFVRIHLTDLTVTRFTSYQNLNKFSAVSDDGRFVAVTSYSGSQPTIYDLENCGQSAAKLQSNWSGAAVSNPCASRDLSAVINDVFSSSGFNAGAKPEFSDDGWQLTTFVTPSAGAGKGVTLNAADYTPPQADLDSDGDGLSDYVESRSYPSRQAVFCGTSCAYPDPSIKDLYVENDWMKEPGLLGRSFKPNTAQLTVVEEAFADQDITVHFDTGQYGGGNELPAYTEDMSFYRDENATDFYDYKYGNSAIAVNFDVDRYRIWHYMISGYSYPQIPNSSGASYVGDDDSFISVGLLEDTTSSGIDDVIAGTILHELGHSLCLSDTLHYVNQSQDCVYGGVHAKNDLTYASYESVMNYDYQFSDLVDLSSGVGMPEDHDDWSAIAIGMDDFIDSDAEGEAPSSSRPNAWQLTPNSVRRITE